MLDVRWQLQTKCNHVQNVIDTQKLFDERLSHYSCNCLFLSSFISFHLYFHYKETEQKLLYKKSKKNFYVDEISFLCPASCATAHILGIKIKFYCGYNCVCEYKHRGFIHKKKSFGIVGVTHA